jgi:uncharacterized protein
MSEFERIQNELRAIKPILQEKYRVKSIGIFGSVARGAHRHDSDVDLLVEFEKPIGMFKFIDLEDELTEKVSRKVDLVSRKGLKPEIGKRILAEVNFI